MQVTLHVDRRVGEDWPISQHLVTRIVEEGRLQTTMATGGFPWTPFYSLMTTKVLVSCLPYRSNVLFYFNLDRDVGSQIMFIHIS